MIEAPYNFLKIAVHPTENLVKTQVRTASTDSSQSALNTDMFSRTLVLTRTSTDSSETRLILDIFYITLVVHIFCLRYFAHMSVNTNKRQKSKMVEFGICLPQETLERLMAIQTPYMNRQNSFGKQWTCSWNSKKDNKRRRRK